jgi:hypothetical protein
LSSYFYSHLNINFFSFPLLLCWMGIYCGIYIYKFTPFHCFLSPPQLLKQFQQVSFLHLHTCIYIIYTIFHHLKPTNFSNPWVSYKTTFQYIPARSRIIPVQCCHPLYATNVLMLKITNILSDCCPSTSNSTCLKRD